jgi:hypothetical protein
VFENKSAGSSSSSSSSSSSREGLRHGKGFDIVLLKRTMGRSSNAFSSPHSHRSPLTRIAETGNIGVAPCRIHMSL